MFTSRDCLHRPSLTIIHLQRTSKDSENNADRFHEGKEHSHKANDSSKDTTSQTMRSGR